MASLLELAWTTHASARRTDVLEAAAEAAARLVPDGFALIWLAHGDRLVLRAAAGRLRQAHGGLQTDFRRGEGLIGAVALAPEASVIVDPATDERTHERAFLLAEGVRTFVGAPLVASYALEGVLGVFSRDEGWPDGAAREAVVGLAARAALALVRLKLAEHVPDGPELVERLERALAGADRAFTRFCASLG